MKIYGTIATAVSLFAWSAHADTYIRVVPTGGKLEIGRYATMNPDCSSVGYATLRVTNAPQHGTVTTYKGKSFPYVPANHPLHDCGMRKMDMMLADYTPERGYTGTDYFTINAIFANGSERTDDYQITVK